MGIVQHDLDTALAVDKHLLDYRVYKLLRQSCHEEEYAFAKQTYEEQYEALNRLLDEAVERRERFLASMCLKQVPCPRLMWVLQS